MDKIYLYNDELETFKNELVDFVEKNWSVLLDVHESKSNDESSS